VLRVIQWATGNVGRHAAAAIHRHPDLELVGALVYSDAKAGRDVGDICGLGPIGVTATTDRDAVVALDADCVVYTPQGEMDPMGALDDICRLLASGKNVVSTAVTAFIHPASAGAAVVERLDAHRALQVPDLGGFRRRPPPPAQRQAGQAPAARRGARRRALTRCQRRRHCGRSPAAKRS
jgi:hypothetical protein